jgi:hypothetical protein
MSNIFATNYGEACYEGLKIGIRRGDLSLVKTCFNEIQKTESSILIPDMLAHLCIEECWYLYGELVKWPMSEPKDVLKACYRMALAPKSKDAFALPALQRLSEQILNSHELGKIIDVELTSAQGYIQWVRRSGLFVEPVEQLHARLFDEITPTGFLPQDTYKRAAISGMMYGLGSGGTMLSHFRTISAMVLFGRRFFTQEKIQAKLQESTAVYKASEEKPSIIPLPWYCYTNNTEIGRKAVETVSADKAIKKAGLTHQDVVSLYTVLETRKVPRKDLNAVKREPSTVAQPWDNIWWLDYLKLKLPKGKKAKESLEIYRNTVLPMLRNTIEKLKGKNGEKES